MRWVWLLGIFALACTQLPPQCANLDPYDTDTCLLDLAFLENQSSYCKTITNDNWKTWCYTDVAANTGNARDCQKISDDSFKNNCLKGVALATKDVNTCVKIAGTSAGDECYRVLGFELSNPELCSFISDSARKDLCYNDVARDVNDYRYCDNIAADDVNGQCVLYTTLIGNETQGCAYAHDLKWQDVCYMNHAVKFLDPTICMKVIDEKISKACRAAIVSESAKKQQ